MIRPCGLNNSKAEHILLATKDILTKFGGQVPSSFEDLISLSGVGRKTADVMIAVAFNGDAIAVDTHVFRVANRIGLAKGENPYQVEMQLMKRIDKNLWSKAHHYLIYHGRQVCKARKPNCQNCVISNYCEYNKKGKKC
jgi:endonuclease-3